MLRSHVQLAIIWEKVLDSQLIEVRLGNKTLKVKCLQDLSLDEQT